MFGGCLRDEYHVYFFSAQRAKKTAGNTGGPRHAYAAKRNHCNAAHRRYPFDNVSVRNGFLLDERTDCLRVKNVPDADEYMFLKRGAHGGGMNYLRSEI